MESLRLSVARALSGWGLVALAVAAPAGCSSLQTASPPDQDHGAAVLAGTVP